jgi:hypothetical protein
LNLEHDSAVGRFRPTSSCSRRRGAAAAALALLAVAAPASAQIAPDTPQAAPDAPKSPGEAARSLRELVDRYLAFRGGETFQALRTVHERVYVETPMSRRPGALWMDRDGRVRREIDGDGAPAIDVATADTAWRTGADGKAADSPGASERARRWALITFGDAFTGRGGAQVALAGTADVDDRSWSVVRITFGDADVYDALIDPTTGGLCCYRITEGGVQRMERLGGWRLVDGVRMPFVDVTTAGGDTAIQVAAVELNRPFDDGLFAPPAALAGVPPAQNVR